MWVVRKAQEGTLLNCPDCNGKMESEEKSSINEGVLSRKGAKQEKEWFIEYFCTMCGDYWTWRKGSPLQRGITSKPDTLDRYARGLVDENGQVW